MTLSLSVKTSPLGCGSTGRGAPGLICRVVGTGQEAQAALDEWLIQEKPSNMLVDPAEDLTQQQWDELRKFLVDRGAETLVQHYAYELVGRPPR